MTFESIGHFNRRRFKDKSAPPPVQVSTLERKTCVSVHAHVKLLLKDFQD
jgi:hypothetical protein